MGSQQFCGQIHVQFLQTIFNFLHSAAQQPTPRSHVERLRQQAQVDALCQATPCWWMQVHSAFTCMPYLVLRENEVLLSQTRHLFRTWFAILIGCLEPISSCAMQDVYDPELAAQRAGEELLAEEERLKAQAAAKKAKKQRQKAKKQQAQASLQTGPALPPELASSEALHHDCMPDAQVPLPSAQVSELPGSEPLCSEQQAPSDGHFPPSGGHEQANGQQAKSGGHQQAADAPAASAQSAESAVEQRSHTDQRQASQSDQASADPCSSSLSNGSASAGTLNRLAPMSTACPDEMADGRQVAYGPEAVQLKQRRESRDQKADHQFLQALFCCPLTHVSLASQARHQCAIIIAQASSHNC